MISSKLEWRWCYASKERANILSLSPEEVCDILNSKKKSVIKKSAINKIKLEKRKTKNEKRKNKELEMKLLKEKIKKIELEALRIVAIREKEVLKDSLRKNNVEIKANKILAKNMLRKINLANLKIYTLIIWFYWTENLKGWYDTSEYRKTWINKNELLVRREIMFNLNAKYHEIIKKKNRLIEVNKRIKKDILAYR